MKFIFLFLTPIFAAADICPRIEGTFECHNRSRREAPFEIRVRSENHEGLINYDIETINGLRETMNIIPDQQYRELTFPGGGKGQYRAVCRAHAKGDSLFIEVHSPDGSQFTDQYYIQSKATVRIRYEGQKTTVLSCCPTRGTWRLYQR